ncbi:hypothetical protein ZIOFF_004868 [Zingiber officinale]|uniref:Uncharacterized protein n=1 Tax=Zingiber officinale TaxID=94328 RepID=A0A8J5HMT4_ZINOF|nr:hypothetical protein ZIOFF_004868 [Zingiber officinale]
MFHGGRLIVGSPRGMPLKGHLASSSTQICQIAGLNPDIKKFKDALAKHITDRCSLGPARGLEKEELLALAANEDLSFDYPSNLVPFLDEVAERTALALPLPMFAQDADNKALALALAVAGR